MVTTTNLVSYWKLDESSGTLVDSHGSNDGTNNGATYSATGKINTGMDFDGTNDYITCGTSLLANYSAASFGAWFKFDTTGSYERILSKTNSSTYNLMVRKTSSETVQAILENTSGTSKTLTGSTTLSTGTWYHVVVTYDGSNMRLYLNGSEDATATALTGNLVNSSDTFTIGRESSGAEYFNGVIDEAFVFQRGLSGTDVSDLYNSGSGLAYPFSSNVTATPSALSLSTTEVEPVIVAGNGQTALTIGMSLVDPTIDGVTGGGITGIGTGGISSRYITTEWPITEGLTAGTTSQEGREMHLKPESGGSLRNRYLKGLY